MTTIHKIAAVVIENNAFLMVRKKGKNTWTSLGGKPEEGESEEETLLREIQEEMGCGAVVQEKLGDFEAPAVHDDAIVKLSVYLVTLDGPIVFEDPELEEYKFLTEDDAKNVSLPDSITDQVIPYCIEKCLLGWSRFS